MRLTRPERAATTAAEMVAFFEASSSSIVDWKITLRTPPVALIEPPAMTRPALATLCCSARVLCPLRASTHEAH